MLHRYMSSMETENQITVRRIYSRHLARFITSLGVTIVRHIRRLVRLLDDYLSIYDGPEEQCRFSCLDALYALLQQAWPRIAAGSAGHADAIMRSLVRLIHDAATDGTTTSRDVTDKLIHRALECVDLLRRICPVYAQLDNEFFSDVAQRKVDSLHCLVVDDR